MQPQKLPQAFCFGVWVCCLCSSVGFCLIVHLNYLSLFHSLITFSPCLSFSRLPPSLSLILAICPATAAPFITVLPDCIPLIPTCFLWLEEQWALLATKHHLGVLPVYAICVPSCPHCAGFQFLKFSWAFYKKLHLSWHLTRFGGDFSTASRSYSHCAVRWIFLLCSLVTVPFSMIESPLCCSQIEWAYGYNIGSCVCNMLFLSFENTAARQQCLEATRLKI